MEHIPKSCATAGIGIEGEKATPGVSSVIKKKNNFLVQSEFSLEMLPLTLTFCII